MVRGGSEGGMVRGGGEGGTTHGGGGGGVDSAVVDVSEGAVVHVLPSVDTVWVQHEVIGKVSKHLGREGDREGGREENKGGGGGGGGERVGQGVRINPTYHIRSNVSDGEGVCLVGGAYHVLGLPCSQDTRLYHEAKLGGQHKPVL